MPEKGRETTAQPSPPAVASEGDRLFAALRASLPARLPTREVAGLPPLAAEALRLGRARARLSGIAARLDRALPGWPERAAVAAASAGGAPLSDEMKALCAALACRPVRDPEPLALAAGSAPDPEARLWLLAALSGTDTTAVRSFWLYDLRERVRAEPEAPDGALWFAFLRAFAGGWLSYADFRDCLALGRVLAAADASGDYSRPLGQLGLTSHPVFGKWYRQVVYQAAHQPDVALQFRAAAWIRDFPGEDYLWDALDTLNRRPDSWWALHLARWASGVDPEGDRLRSRLAGASPVALGLLSLLRPELSGAIGEACDLAHHEEAIDWLMTASPDRALDLRLLESRLRPWAEQVGDAVTLACGALCSADPPDDFPGPTQPVLRRREFARGLVPEFDRVMANLACVHALRREHFEALCQQARRGKPGAVRALALWPERAEESAPILFRLTREGAKPAKRAAGESLDILRARLRVADLRELERRLDLASAWADAGLEGRSARAWWDVAGYHVRLSVAAGAVSLQVFSGPRRLTTVPKAVREHPDYAEIRRARAELARGYRYFRRRFEEAMVEGAVYHGSDFATLMMNPIVRSLVSRLVLSLDGRPLLWAPDDPLAEAAPPEAIASAAEVRVAHPLALMGSGALGEWQQRVVEGRVPQPFKQVFREVYLPGEGETAGTHCQRFAGQPLVARRAFALLRSQGYSPGRGDAVRERPSAGVVAHIQWAGPAENAGRLLGRTDTVETVTSGPVWFADAEGRPLALAQVDPVVFTETLRDTDLLVSRAGAGELGFTSEEAIRLRGTLVRYLTRVVGLTTIYVADDANYVLVEGTRAMYRVHLGSGSVLLENSRRHLDTVGIESYPLTEIMEESLDSVTARVLATIFALARDDRITDEAFLRQL